MASAWPGGSADCGGFWARGSRDLRAPPRCREWSGGVLLLEALQIKLARFENFFVLVSSALLEFGRFREFAVSLAVSPSLILLAGQ